MVCAKNHQSALNKFLVLPAFVLNLGLRMELLTDLLQVRCSVVEWCNCWWGAADYASLQMPSRTPSRRDLWPAVCDGKPLRRMA